MKVEESIQLIESMILEVKKDFSYNGFHFLLWGWLVFLASVVNYLLLNYIGYSSHWIGWPILMGVGGIITAVVTLRDKKSRSAQTILNRVMGQLWLAVIIGIVVLLVLMPQIGISRTYPFFVLLYGIGTFATGRIIKFTPLIIGGALCFVLTVVAAYQNFSNQLIIIALAILVSYIIPGHLLYNKSQKECLKH